MGLYLQSTRCPRMPAARNPACSLQMQQVIQICTNLRQRARVEHCARPLLWPWTRLWRIQHLLCCAPLPRLGLRALCKSARGSYAGRCVHWVAVVWSLSRVPLCNPLDCSTPGFPVHHRLPEVAQIHVHGVSDAIQPSHPLSTPSPPTFNLSQHQGLF